MERKEGNGRKMIDRECEFSKYLDAIKMVILLLSKANPISNK